MPTQTFDVDDLAKENAKLSKDVIRMAIDLEDHKKVDARMPRSKWNSGKPGKLAGYKSSKDLGSRVVGAKEVSFSGLNLVDSLTTYPISQEFDPLQVVEENNFETHKALPMKDRISKMKQVLVQRDVVQISEGDSDIGLEVPVKKIPVTRTQDPKIQKLKKDYKVFKDEDKKTLHELEKEEQSKPHQTASVVNLLVPDPAKPVAEVIKNSSEPNNTVTQKATRSRVGQSSLAKTQKSSFHSDEVNSHIMLPPEPLTSANPTNAEIFRHRKKKRNSVLNSPVKRATQKDDEGSLIINNTIKEKNENTSPSSPTRPAPVKEKPKYTYDAALSDWLSGLNLKEPEKVKDIFFSNNISLMKMHLLNAKDLTRFGFKQSDPDFVKILRGLIELKEDYSRFPEKYKMSPNQKFPQKESGITKGTRTNGGERRISGEGDAHRKTVELTDSAEGLLPPISHQQGRGGQHSVSSSTEIDHAKVTESSPGAKHLPLERVGSGSLVNHAVEFQKSNLNDSTGSIPSNNTKDWKSSEMSPPQSHDVIMAMDVSSITDPNLPADCESFTNDEQLEGDLKESPVKNFDRDDGNSYTGGDNEMGDGTARKVLVGAGFQYNKDPAKLSKVLSSDLAHKDAITALELATRKWERRQKEQEEELEKAEKLEKQKKNERDRLAARHASRRRMQQQLQVQQQINALSSDVTVNSTNQIGAPPQEDPSDQNSSPERNNANQVTREDVAINTGELDFELIGAKIKPLMSSRGSVNPIIPSSYKGLSGIPPSGAAAVAVPPHAPNTSQKSKRVGNTTNDTLPSDRVDPENGLMLEGKAVSNSPRVDYNKPQTQRHNRDTEAFRADQQAVHTFRGKTYDKDFQLIKKDLEDVLGQLENPDSLSSHIPEQSKDTGISSDKSDTVLMEATKRKISSMESGAEREAMIGDMQYVDSNFTESNPPNGEDGSVGSDMAVNKGAAKEEILSKGKHSNISTNSTHDLLQQLETKLQTLKDSGSSPETLSMIEKIKNQLAQFEAANPQMASRFMSEYPSYARPKGPRKVSSAKTVGPGGSGTREKSVVDKDRSRSRSKSKTLLTMRTSMAEQDMVRSLQKQQTQYKQQIKNLERELKRLKENDPLQSCELNIEDLQYSEEDHIGDGAFADVFWGYYSGSEVAIKRLKNQLSSSDESYFNAEVALLRELRHPNVVLLLGTCRDSRGHPLMVLEYMASGSLFDVLHDFERPGLDHVAFYQICKDMAVGMNYLHKHKPGPVLHLDLKSMNVLLDIYGKAKIGDFGFSKLKTNADSGTEKQLSVESRKGSPAWMAPETLQQGKVSTKSDVYSFGIILWEMLTREKPYEGMGLYRVLEGVTKGLRPLIPGWVPDELQMLIQKCWHAQPSMRPSFQEVLEILDNLHLPVEWKSLLDAAGVPRIALEDPDVTRSIVEFVHLSLNVSDCSSSAPTSGEGLSASLIHQERQMIDLEVVSALEMLTRKQKEKSYQSLVPTLANFSDSFSDTKSLLSSQNKGFPLELMGSEIPRASTEMDFGKQQPVQASTRRASVETDKNVYTHSSRPRTVIGGSGGPIRYQISDAILQNQKAKLRPTTVAPHPSQLAKLSGIDEGKLSSIAAIIKQALNERREQMGDGYDDDSSTVVGDGSERSDDLN